ncbi:MAG: VWA domain-containing protein [Deltaproteobacteria bacterium]|nr:VWA domain-containing protein [Deltaproteobacteria bacterium]
MLSGCTDKKIHSKGVYMLLGTSGMYAHELKKAQSILNFLLLTLQPLDTLAVARIDTGNFAEKDIIAKVTFNQRPSVANNQKRVFQKKIDNFVSNIKNSKYTDISGGISQAIEDLNETDPGKKYILLFSDLKEELKKGHVNDMPFQLAGFHIIALNVTKLSADVRDPKEYLKHVVQWRAKVESGNGKWRVVNDLERLENIFAK